MSIRRIVELVLDRGSAQNVEKGTKSALDRGTDPKKAKSNLSSIGGALKGLASIAAKLGLALGAAFVVRKIKDFGTEAVRVATESRAVWNRLAGQLAIAGVAYKDVQGEIKAAADQMQATTKVADEDFAAILQELVSTTNDYAGSMREVETVANLAAAKNLDFKTAAQLVGRAMVGQTGTLSRYGIVVQEGADVMEVLRSRFAGMAANETRTLEGKVAQLSNGWADFKEAVGNAIIEAGNGTSAIDTLTGVVRGLTDWLDTNRGAVVDWAHVVGRGALAAYESVRFVVRELFNFGQILGAVFQHSAATMERYLAPAVNRVADLLDRIPGVDIPIRLNELTPEEYAIESARLAAAIRGDAGDMVDALTDLGTAYRDVGVAAVEAATAQRAATGDSSTLATGPGGVVGGGGASIAAAGAPNLTGVLRDDFRTQFPGLADEIRTSYASVWAQLQSDAANAGPFDGLIDQSSAAADFMRDGFKGVGKSIVGDLIEGRAGEQFAAGLAALASGIWPPNPAALAASAKHFAAAAAFRALGSQGGGGRGAVASAGALATSSSTAGTVPGPEVHIYLDPLSASDRRFQQVVRSATEQARANYGENMRVQIHPRTGQGV